MKENDITYLVRKAIFKVYNTLGPGLLETVYQEAMLLELRKLGLSVDSQVPVKVIYEELVLNCGFRADIVVEQKVIIEIKSIEALAPVHHAQLLTYLKASGKKLGLLVNFNTDKIGKSIFRKINGKLDP